MGWSWEPFQTWMLTVISQAQQGVITTAVLLGTVYLIVHKARGPR